MLLKCKFIFGKGVKQGGVISSQVSNVTHLGPLGSLTEENKKGATFRQSCWLSDIR